MRRLLITSLGALAITMVAICSAPSASKRIQVDVLSTVKGGCYTGALCVCGVGPRETCDQSGDCPEMGTCPFPNPDAYNVKEFFSCTNSWDEGWSDQEDLPQITCDRLFHCRVNPCKHIQATPLSSRWICDPTGPDPAPIPNIVTPTKVDGIPCPDA